MRLTSTAFPHNGEIPIRYTSEGIDVSPPLAWTGVPANARSLALIVDDPDAPDPEQPTATCVHWVVADLPPQRTHLHESIGMLAQGHVGVNDWNRAKWNGPAPAIGRHRYFFRLFALDQVLDLPRPTKSELEQAMSGHIVAEATLVGTYEKRRH